MQDWVIKLFQRNTFLAIRQTLSICSSFLSLSLASVKLFYCQRLGRFPDIDPSWKMTAFTLAFVVLLLIGPIYSLVITTAYLRGWVTVGILFIIVCHSVVTKLPCLEEKLFPLSALLYTTYPTYTFSTNGETQEINDSRLVLFIANVTSWIAPCTVWTNTLRRRSPFLVLSSTICALGHFFLLSSVFAFSFYAEFSPVDNPPILHCFKDIVKQQIG